MQFSRRLVVVSLVAIAAILTSAVGHAEELGAINTLGSDGVAIRGTDPVAYFTEGRPVAGDPAITLDYRGAEWRFASEENKTLFAAEPEKYVPAYGGYCAYGVAQDYLVKIEPDAWTIHDGRLYLNYDRSVRATWEKDIPGYVAVADENFPGLIADR